MEIWWDHTDEKSEVLGKRMCPSAALSTINRTWTLLGGSIGFRGKKSTANLLSYGTASFSRCFVVVVFVLVLVVVVLVLVADVVVIVLFFVVAKVTSY
jgi:hypothetical protein